VVKALTHNAARTHTYTHVYIYAYIVYTMNKVHIYTCTYEYIHNHTHTYTHTHIPTHTHTQTHKHTNTNTHTHIHTYTHVHTRTHTHSHRMIFSESNSSMRPEAKVLNCNTARMYTHRMYTCTYTHVHTNTPTHTCAHTHTHTHKHTHTHIHTQTGISAEQQLHDARGQRLKPPTLKRWVHALYVYIYVYALKRRVHALNRLPLKHGTNRVCVCLPSKDGYTFPKWTIYLLGSVHLQAVSSCFHVKGRINGFCLFKVCFQTIHQMHWSFFMGWLRSVGPIKLQVSFAE